MLKETLEFLKIDRAKVVLDATLGTGGHAQAILERAKPDIRFIGLDRDSESLEIAKDRLKNFKNCEFIQGNFSEMDILLNNIGVKKVDAVLFDLGISSFQLENPQRGFSFQNDGPLDMRMDRDSYVSAYDLVNNLNEDELSDILWNYGQERWHNRIARFLVRERETHPIATTTELSEIVKKAIPYRYRHFRIHPATRTFQAVRIAVNRELETLEGAITKAIELLNKNGRVCIITFHSLEDRIAKFTFRKAKASGLIDIITPKPLPVGEEEAKENPKSRSAKLRVAEKKII